MTPRPITRYLLRLVCHACSRGFYAAVPLILPQACPAGAGGRLRPGGVQCRAIADSRTWYAPGPTPRTIRDSMDYSAVLKDL